jgi:hypothetical protein
LLSPSPSTTTTTTTTTAASTPTTPTTSSTSTSGLSNSATLAALSNGSFWKVKPILTPDQAKDPTRDDRSTHPYIQNPLQFLQQYDGSYVIYQDNKYTVFHSYGYARDFADQYTALGIFPGSNATFMYYDPLHDFCISIIRSELHFTASHRNILGLLLNAGTAFLKQYLLKTLPQLALQSAIGTTQQFITPYNLAYEPHIFLINQALSFLVYHLKVPYNQFSVEFVNMMLQSAGYANYSTFLSFLLSPHQQHSLYYKQILTTLIRYMARTPTLSLQMSLQTSLTSTPLLELLSHTYSACFLHRQGEISKFLIGHCGNSKLVDTTIATLPQTPTPRIKYHLDIVYTLLSIGIPFVRVDNFDFDHIRRQIKSSPLTSLNDTNNKECYSYFRDQMISLQSSDLTASLSLPFLLNGGPAAGTGSSGSSGSSGGTGNTSNTSNNNLLLTLNPNPGSASMDIDESNLPGGVAASPRSTRLSVIQQQHMHRQSIQMRQSVVQNSELSLNRSGSGQQNPSSFSLQNGDGQLALSTAGSSSILQSTTINPTSQTALQSWQNFFQPETVDAIVQFVDQNIITHRPIATITALGREDESNTSPLQTSGANLQPPVITTTLSNNNTNNNNNNNNSPSLQNDPSPQLTPFNSNSIKRMSKIQSFIKDSQLEDNDLSYSDKILRTIYFYSVKYHFPIPIGSLDDIPSQSSITEEDVSGRHSSSTNIEPFSNTVKQFCSTCGFEKHEGKLCSDGTLSRRQSKIRLLSDYSRNIQSMHIVSPLTPNLTYPSVLIALLNYPDQSFIHNFVPKFVLDVLEFGGDYVLKRLKKWQKFNPQDQYNSILRPALESNLSPLSSSSLQTPDDGFLLSSQPNDTVSSSTIMTNTTNEFYNPNIGLTNKFLVQSLLDKLPPIYSWYTQPTDTIAYQTLVHNDSLFAPCITDDVNIEAVTIQDFLSHCLIAYNSNYKQFLNSEQFKLYNERIVNQIEIEEPIITPLSPHSTSNIPPQRQQPQQRQPQQPQQRQQQQQQSQLGSTELVLLIEDDYIGPLTTIPTQWTVMDTQFITPVPCLGSITGLCKHEKCIQHIKNIQQMRKPLQPTVKQPVRSFYGKSEKDKKKLVLSAGTTVPQTRNTTPNNADTNKDTTAIVPPVQPTLYNENVEMITTHTTPSILLFILYHVANPSIQDISFLLNVANELKSEKSISSPLPNTPVNFNNNNNNNNNNQDTHRYKLNLLAPKHQYTQQTILMLAMLRRWPEELLIMLYNAMLKQSNNNFTMIFSQQDAMNDSILEYATNAHISHYAPSFVTKLLRDSKRAVFLKK